MFAQIAKRAGLSSTGLISYHFANRDELIEQAAAQIVGAITAFMTERMAGSPAPPTRCTAISTATSRSSSHTGRT